MILTKIAMRRNGFFLNSSSVKNARIIEIGAFDNPTFLKEDGHNVVYLDYFSKEELIEMHKNNERRNFDNVVKVDYVVKSSQFAETVGSGFDVVVANHVIEHIPNLIGWFQQVSKLLDSGGLLLLSVPDRRYTFDYYRPVTTAVELIFADAEGLERPSIWQLAEHFYYHQKVDLPELWRGKQPARFEPRFSLAKAMELAELKSKTYTDAHCSVFTADSFAQCVDSLGRSNYLDFRIESIHGPERGLNEFWATLKKAGEVSPETAWSVTPQLVRAGPEASPPSCEPHGLAASLTTDKFQPSKSEVTMSNLPLPPANMRWGGPRYRDDATFLKSGIGGAKMLERECDVTAKSRVLDIGCGQARLLHGLVNHFGSIGRYVGIDVHKPSINWLRQNLEPIAPYTAFHHVSVRNDRYNPKGDDNFSVKLREKFDCVTLMSVFSHMLLKDIRVYLRFIREHLDDNGKVHLTAFVEDNVPSETENPEGYHREWTGALHCVRLNRQEFEAMAKDAGLQVEWFQYRVTNDGQSSYIFGRRGKSFSAVVAN